MNRLVPPAALLLVACAPDAAPRTPGPVLSTVELSLAAHGQDLPVPALSSTPSALTVQLRQVSNPSQQAFALRVVVQLRAPGAASRDVEVGHVTPYPADQPMTLQLSLPEAARALLSAHEGQRALRITLEPIAPDRPLVPPLTVTLAVTVTR